MKKIVNSGSDVTITDYLGFQYETLNSDPTELKFFPHAEGYVNNTVVSNENVYNYVYNYTDHLGNIRMRYTLKVTTGGIIILEEDHYYPYGLKHTKYNTDTWDFIKTEDIPSYPTGVELSMTVTPGAYQQKYNGKEWQADHGLNMYAMDMRQYDPAIARWVVLDPIVHHSQSQYNGYDGNPVYFADPSGGSVSDMMGTDMNGLVRYNEYGLFIPNGERARMRSERIDTGVNNGHNSTKGKTLYQDDMGSWVRYFVRNEKVGGYVENDEVKIIYKAIYELRYIPAIENGSVREFVGIGASLGEIGMLEKQVRMFDMRKGLGVNDKIGNFRHFSNRYNNIERLGKFAGRASNLLTAHSLYSDYKDPTVSSARFSYRAGSAGASILTSTVVGAYSSGPGGALAGFVVGLVSAGGEAVYDGWNNTIMPTINQGTYNINNEHGYSNFHP